MIGITKFGIVEINMIKKTKYKNKIQKQNTKTIDHGKDNKN